MMNFNEFEKFIKQECMYETIYKDSEGRTILVVKLIDAFEMVHIAIKKENKDE